MPFATIAVTASTTTTTHACRLLVVSMSGIAWFE